MKAVHKSMYLCHEVDKNDGDDDDVVDKKRLSFVNVKTSSTMAVLGCHQIFHNANYDNLLLSYIDTTKM